MSLKGIYNYILTTFIVSNYGT